MGLISWIKGQFSRDRPQNSYRLGGFPFFFGKSESGKTVTEFTALQNAVVLACVRVLAESVATLPLNVYEHKGGGKEKAFKHQLYYLLHDAPNPDMTSFVFRETLMTHLLLYGNAYAQIVRDGHGQIIGLYPLLPNKMTVEREDTGAIIYTYMPHKGENPNVKNEGQIKLSAYNVLHVCGLAYNGLIGYSPIAMARNAIGLSLACEELGSKFFSNGARPSGVLKCPTVLKDPSKLRESWEAAYGGSENAGKIAILEQGLSYESISVPNSDSQFLETRRFQIEEIARIFRVPLNLINDLTHATYSNVEQESLNFVVYSLTPWLVRWEQALNKALFKRDERGRYFVKFAVEGLLRGDYASRINGYCQLIQNGVMSVNEARSLEDLNPISAEDGGDLHIINGAMTKLSDAGIFAKGGKENGQ